MTKDELMKIVHIDAKLDSKLRQLAELRETIISISAVDYSKENVQVEPSSAIENSVIRLTELENEIEDDIDKLVAKKKHARDQISAVEGVYGTVLEMRYLECMRWEEIAFRLSYGIRHIHRLHGEALEMIKSETSR